MYYSELLETRLREEGSGLDAEQRAEDVSYIYISFVRELEAKEFLEKFLKRMV